jgi:preprotein translocase subunit YajC
VDIILLVALGALLIFFMFNSRKKQKARMQEITDNLVPGAKVMTSFGVYGTVLSVDQENLEVTLESGPGTVLRVHRQAIGQIQTPAVESAADLPDPAAGAAAGPVAGTEPIVDRAEPTADRVEPLADEGDEDRITDAELDAINEARRTEDVDGGSSAAAAEGPGDPEDPSIRDDKR